MTVPGADSVADGGWTVIVRGSGPVESESLGPAQELGLGGTGGSTMMVFAGGGTTESFETCELLIRLEIDMSGSTVADVSGGEGGSTVIVTGPVVGLLDVVVLGKAVIVVKPRVDEEFV